MTIRDELANGKSYESLALSASDENLLGKNNPEREKIWKIIKQCIHAKQVQISFNNHEISYSSKIHQVENLRISFTNFLKGTHIPSSIKSKQWFQSQQSIDQFKLNSLRIKG